MADLELKNAHISFGAGALLDGASLVIEPGERVGLLGRNGAGKTTLMRILAGDLDLDEGEVTMRPGLVVTRLEQDVPKDVSGTVADLVRDALEECDHEDWEIDKRLERELGRFELDGTALVSELSAGMKRRTLLARALAHEPDLLILDEPTNHLELDAIASLERVLLSRRASLLFVTHDRAFLRKVATRILDLDRGQIKSYECDYGTYLERKAADLAAEEKQNAEFDKHLAKEEVWIRQGVLARRTRNMGRVRSLQSLREQRSDRRNVVGEAKAKVQETERSGRLVLRAKGVDFSYPGNVILDGFNIELLRGDRVGIVGPNGVGKSTLIQLLLGELEPDAGFVHHGTKLEVARFDQLHDSLNPERTVAENVTGAGDTVFQDGHARNVISYLADFLFTPDQVRGGITKLSGGEKNRLQLAKILSRPCNLLVLDEPTNDLDLETLEMLEELLTNYKGTLLLVSHDREFLENVVTSILAPTGDQPGVWEEFMGGYQDWQRALKERAEAATGGNPKGKGSKADWKAGKAAAKANRAAAKGGKSGANGGKSGARGASGGKSGSQGAKSGSNQSKASNPKKAKKLTFTEAHELKTLPNQIEVADKAKAAQLARLSDPDYYKLPQAQQSADRAKLKKLESNLEVLMNRWEELESLQK